MPVDASRIQGFGSTPEPQKSSGNFSGFLDALRDQVSGPAMRSAVDSLSLQITDALEAAQEDMSEMAFEFKSFASSAIGIQPSSSATSSSTKETSASDGVVVHERRAEVVMSPRQKAEATTLLSKFCSNYGAARVAPRPAELEDLWLRCSVLQPNTVASAIYEQLSFADGDLEWQPRLRILYLLETFYWKGGVGRNITDGILNHGGGLLQHLATEVPQTKEKAEQVIQVLSGQAGAPPESQKVEAAAASAVASSAKAPMEKRAAGPAPQEDLLDLAAPSSGATSSAAPAAAAATGPVDLLNSPQQARPADPPVVDLISIMSTPAPAPAAAPAAALPADFNPNPNPAGGLASLSLPAAQPGSASWAAFSMAGPGAAPLGTQQPQSHGLPGLPNSSAMGGVAAMRDARAGYGQVPQPKAMQQLPPQPRRYIPAPQELPPGERQADPFAWAEDITKTASQSAA
mmetsp:Transcript_80487/g.152894  ORF Transcript_80487/g.152894 Transcript_80487/m.152894 type:complete len:460 (-) Transcript_80487:139-1518(-)